MTTPIEQDDGNPLEDRLIDRLVDGMLAGPERRAVLARLERDPDGWRRCALAFLEAQAWSEALRPVAVTAGVPGRGHPTRESRAEDSPRPGAPRRALRPVAIAAGLLAAFALGWGVRDGRREARLATIEPVRDRRVVAAPAPVPEVVTAPRTSPAHPTLTADPVVERLERQGYQVERRQRLVSMETTDGRRLAVPVEEVQLRFVGDRTY
jgi:hypothetical protein